MTESYTESHLHILYLMRFNKNAQFEKHIPVGINAEVSQILCKFWNNACQRSPLKLMLLPGTAIIQNGYIKNDMIKMV